MKLLFLIFCIKSELEEQRGHKVVTVKSIEFDLLLLVSLQCHAMRGMSTYATLPFKTSMKINGRELSTFISKMVFKLPKNYSATKLQQDICLSKISMIPFPSQFFTSSNENISFLRQFLKVNFLNIKQSFQHVRHQF